MMTKKKITLMVSSVALLITLLAGAVFGQGSQKTTLFRYLSIFSEVLDLVRTNYVEPVATNQLIDGAFAGVTDGIDEFSYYVPPAQIGAYRKFTDVEDNRIGLVVTKRYGFAFVLAPVAGSPAEKAGIERGDFIEKVDGVPTMKMSVWQVRSALQTGKPVKLQILRAGQTKREEITVAPQQFHPVALTTSRFGSVAYVKIPYFDKGSADQVRAALDEARKNGTKKLIIDLRSNAGGDVEEAIAAADHLLSNGMITSRIGRKVEARQWQADRATSYDGEVHVLVDNSTASGAEIFAAAVRGNSRGKVIGVTTYGKSIIQRFIPLQSGGGVQMTIGHYTTPDQKPIKEQGVRPDVVVDLSAQAVRETAEKKEEPEEDLILNKSLSLFGEQIPRPATAKKAA